MGRRKRREFTPEFKANAVRLVRDGGKSVREVVAEFDLTETALRDGLRRSEVNERRDPGGPLTTDERAELARLRREFKTVSMERDFLRNGCRLLREGTGVNFELGGAEEAMYPTALMCRALGVSRSGYLDWRSRKPSERELDDGRLDLEVSSLFLEKERDFGSPQMHRELRLRGRRSSRKRIAASMRRQRHAARRRKKFVATTDSKHSETIAPNLVQRNFTVEAPNRVWVADTTYLPTLVGFVYLVAVIDLYARKVVGWCVGDTLDSALWAEALRRAIACRKPSQGLVFHSDRGSELAAARVRELLKGIDAKQSMIRKGDCWENAVAESFFSTLKFEGPALTACSTAADVEPALVRFIDAHYNSDRLHSFIGDRSSDEAETTWRRTARAR